MVRAVLQDEVPAAAGAVSGQAVGGQVAPLDGGGAEPVQGVLFSEAELVGEHCAYPAPVATKVSGITYRQLDYWATRHIVEPSLHSSQGSGSRRLYAFKDILLLAIAKRLLDAGVHLQTVKVAIGYLRKHSVNAMTSITIISDGESVYQCTRDEEMLDLLKGGKAVFALSIGTLRYEIEERLGQEQGIDLDEQAISEKTGRVIDELAAVRLRKKLALREQARAVA